jgi:hypothetical protein
MSNYYLTRIRRVLSCHGIRDYRIEHRRRHRMVRVCHGGRNVSVTFPSSGSDKWRGARNAEAYLRRRLRGAATL